MPDDRLRVAYLTAGAAGMYCGSCMHDNTLARALTRAGVDVQLIPTYTPIRTDEDNVSLDRVFFGGLNVYLQQKIPLFRILPSVLDRFLDSPWLIRRVTSRGVDASPELLGKLTVSMLRGLDGNQRKEVRRLAKWLRSGQHPDLLVLSNILIGGCIPGLKEELGVPVVVTLQGDDIFLEELPPRYRKQAIDEIRRLAESVDAFIAHSRFYADAMSDYLGIDRQKIRITPLGIDTDDLQPTAGVESRRSRPPVIAYLARLAPEKGLHNLVDAYLQLRGSAESPPARLHVAGWLAPHRRAYAMEQFQRLESAGLGDEFQYFGSVDRAQKVEFLRGADVMCVPTTYHEPKGLFALEALACGIPIVQPRHGAFPELIEDTRGGVLVTPNDAGELAEALKDLLVNSDRRLALGRAGRESVLQRRSAGAMAESTIDIFRGVLQRAGEPLPPSDQVLNDR